MNFSDLAPQCIEHITKVLQAYEDSNNQDDGYGDPSERSANLEEIAFESHDGQKVFDCVFQSMNRNEPHRIAQSREKECLRFLNAFMKLYERWEHKMVKKNKLEDMKYEEEEEDRWRSRSSYGMSGNSRPGQMKKRNVYGKRGSSSSSRNVGATSRFFPSKRTVSDDPEDDLAAAPPLAFSDKKKRPKAKTKMEKLSEKVLKRALQRGYESFSDDEDEKMKAKEHEEAHGRLMEQKNETFNELQDTHTREEAVAADSAIEDIEETDDEALPTTQDRTFLQKSKKRNMLPMGKRLKKKVRIQEEDDDSDFEFDNTHNTAISGAAMFDDEDGSHQDDNHDDHGSQEGDKDLTKIRGTSKPQQTITGMFRLKKPSTVTPTRLQNTDTKEVEPAPSMDGAITDEGSEGDVETDAISPEITKPAKHGIKSFFDNTDATRIRTKPKIRGASGRVNCTSTADDILNSTSPRRSTPLKLGAASPLRSSSPVKPKRMDGSMSALKSPVRNPYKKNGPSSTNTGHVGLRNLGNTCYLNSSLQIIFSVPGFLTDLSAAYDELKPTDANANEDEETNDTMPLCSALLSVASSMKLIPARNPKDAIREGPAHPSILKKEMDKLTDKFAGFEQRDAHEFLSDLIDFMHDELQEAKTSHDNYSSVLPTDKYFRLDVNVCFTCNSCKYSRCKEEMYRHLSLDIGKNKNGEPWTVDQGLEQFFQPEHRDIKCEKCKEGLAATQTMTVKSRPKALLLHLKRFIVETNGRDVSWRKSTARVKSERSISLEKFIADESNESDTNQEYGLQGVVRHIGKNAFSGHYTADANRKASTGQEHQWISFDDGNSCLLSIEQVLSNERNQQNNYMMIYGR